MIQKVDMAGISVPLVEARHVGEKRGRGVGRAVGRSEPPAW